MTPWMGLHAADSPPLPKPPLMMMITTRMNRATPAANAMTRKNDSALRAPSTSRIGLSDMSCPFGEVSSEMVDRAGPALVVVADHPPPHVRGEEREDPPLQRVRRVAPAQPVGRQPRRRDPLDGGACGAGGLRRLTRGEEERVVDLPVPAVDEQGQVDRAQLPGRQRGP